MWKLKLAMHQAVSWTKKNWPVVLLAVVGLAVLQNAC